MKVSFVFLCLLIVCCSVVSADTLEANSLLVKISTSQGDVFNRSVSFSSSSGGVFNVLLEGLPAEISASADSLSLDPGQSKPLTLLFDTSLLKPGVYVGSLVVVGKTARATVPVILEVETEDVFFDINLDIPPQYTEVHPGEKVVAQIKVFDLVSGGTGPGLGPTNVLITYAIVDSVGKQVSAETETVSVDITTQITQALGFPDTMPTGDYVFYVTATYKSSVGTSSHIFKISNSPQGLSALKVLDSQTYLLIGVLSLFFFGIIGFFIYLLRDRDSLILELHNLNSQDYRRQRSFIQAQARVLVHKKGSSVAPVVRHELRQLKHHHHARLVQLRVLKRKGDVQAMKRQLAVWKQEYHSGRGLTKLHGLSPSEMKIVLTRWKRDYTH